MKTCTDFASLRNQFTPSTYIWRMHEEHDTFSTFIFMQLAKRGESNYQNVVRHGLRRRERKRGDEKDIIELCAKIFCCRKLRHNFLWNFQIIRYYVGMSMSLAISTTNYFITQYSDSPRGMETKQEIRPTHSEKKLVSELCSATEMFNFKPLSHPIPLELFQNANEAMNFQRIPNRYWPDIFCSLIYSIENWSAYSVIGCDSIPFSIAIIIYVIRFGLNDKCCWEEMI